MEVQQAEYGSSTRATTLKAGHLFAAEIAAVHGYDLNQLRDGLTLDDVRERWLDPLADPVWSGDRARSRRHYRASAVAVAARDRQRAEVFAEKHGVERVLGSYAEVIAELKPV